MDLLFMISMAKKFFEHSMKKNCKKKKKQQKFRIEKVIIRKGSKLMSNGKVMIIHLITGLIKNMLNEILSNAIPLYKN